MKKINQIISIFLLTFLLFTPGFVFAVEEGTGTGTEIPENTEGESKEEENKTEEPTVTETISLDKETASLTGGDSITLSATTNSESSITWTSSDESVATVDENGKVTAKDVDGTVTITATIKNTEISASCTITVTKKVLSGDATLKSLTIENGTLDKSFDKDTFEYTVTIDGDVSALKFTSLNNDRSDSNASWQVTGNKNLKDGSTVKIIVTAEDGTINTYTLTMAKTTVNLNLKSLKITGYAFNESFSAGTLEYTVNIPYDVTVVTISAVAEDENATVTVSNTKNLGVGDNTALVTVKDDYGNSKVYTVTIIREEESEVEENATSILSSKLANTTSSSVISESNSKSDNFIKYLVVSIACLILFVIGGIGIYFYLKTSPRKLKKEILKEKEKIDSNPIIEVENNNKTENNVIETLQEETPSVEEPKEDLFDEKDV